MEFLAPLMLFGLLAIAIPIAIHLFGKQRAKVVRFAAVDFLLGSDERVARRLRLRDLLLLILRALICLALPLTLAKPYASCETRGPSVSGGPQATVIVIDNSLASSFEIGDRTLLEIAAERAQFIIDQLGPDSEIALVLAAEGSPPISELSSDHLKIAADIAGLAAVPRKADTTSALRRAAALLATSPRETQRIFLISPLAATGFRAGESPWAEDAAPDMTVIDVAEDQSLSNLAVTELSVSRDPDSGSRGVRVVATVANFGDKPAANVPALLRIGSEVVARGSISIGAASTAEKIFTGSLPDGARSAPVTVEITGDSLALDNSRYAIGELRDQVRTLLVNGDPRSARHNDELFYLDAALRPGDRDESGIVVARTTPSDLGKVNLENYDVVVLANCVALQIEQSELLADWVKRGGGLWVALGSNVEAADYNSTMSKLLAGSLRSLSDTGFGRRGAEKSGSAVHLAKLELDHPLFASLESGALTLRDANFGKLFLLGTTTDVEKRRVLARYDNGASAIIEASLGSGRLLLYTSTIDRDWNDLPIQPSFLPLAQQAVRYLGRKPTDLRRRTSLVGGVRMLRVPADVERIEVSRPDGGRTTLDEGIGEGGRATFEDTDRPGFYSVATARSGKEELEAAFSEDFALNIAVGASDLTRLDPSNLPKGAGGTGASIADTSHKRRVELWHAVAALLLGFLALESLLALRG